METNNRIIISPHNYTRDVGQSQDFEIYQTKVVRGSDANSRINDILSSGALEVATNQPDIKDQTLEAELLYNFKVGSNNHINFENYEN